VGIRLHSYRNCTLDVWRFSPTRQYLICHRSGWLGDRVGYTLDFELTPLPKIGPYLRATNEEIRHEDCGYRRQRAHDYQGALNCADEAEVQAVSKELVATS
jgi:hypothetical protein